MAAIAELAVSLVSDGDALVVGAGTTTQAFARRLTRFSELPVVTNSLLVAPMQTVPPARIAHLITDDRADPAHLAELRSAGVEVQVAGVPGDGIRSQSD